MRNRKSIYHHQSYHHLFILRSPIPTISSTSQPIRPGSLKIRTGYTIKYRLHFHRKQITKATIQMQFYLLFIGNQSVQREVIGLKPFDVYLYPSVLFPQRQEPFSIAIVCIHSFQPSRQAVFAARFTQPIGYQPRKPIGKIFTPCELIQKFPKP